jgi:hypothetical protein
MNADRTASSFIERLAARAIENDRIARRNDINNGIITVKFPFGYTPSVITPTNPQTAFLPTAPQFLRYYELSKPQVLPSIRVPDTPTIISALRGDSNVIVRIGSSSSDGGSPIILYVIYAYSGETIINILNFGPPFNLNTGFDISGLISGRTYTFGAVARNAIGPSLESNRSNPVIPGTVPSAPTISSMTGGDSNVTITLGASSSAGGLPITE